MGTPRWEPSKHRAGSSATAGGQSGAGGADLTDGRVVVLGKAVADELHRHGCKRKDAERPPPCGRRGPGGGAARSSALTARREPPGPTARPARTHRSFRRRRRPTSPVCTRGAAPRRPAGPRRPSPQHRAKRRP